MERLFVFLFLYQIKHFVCDYILQGKYMLGKFKAFPEYIEPLLAHVGVHFVGTFVLACAYNPNNKFWYCIQLGLYDAAIHFVMDRIKASPILMGRWKALSANEYMVLQNARDLTSFYPNITKSKKQLMNGNKLFWWCLGFDQMVHHLTHYFILYLLWMHS